MSWIFGIDGGATHSRMVIFSAETGEIVSRVEGGSTNLYGAPEETVLKHLAELLRQGVLLANISLDELSCGCLGSAGLSRAREQAVFNAFFKRMLPNGRVKLCNDGEILLVGSLHSLEGYSLIGGTGSLALARRLNGETLRAGGLGYMLGDEGSACWIGWQAVKRALCSLEERDLPTALMPKLLDYFALSTPTDFIELMHHHFHKATVAGAAPLVLEAAQAGDALAEDIALKAAKELCLLLTSVAKRMVLPNPKAALSGGVIEHSALLRSHLLQALHEQLPAVEIVVGQGDAVAGACLLAKQFSEE
ncbi:MAG: BadF/BadG/BcrA/BcrD ATPase family protein [Clostridia bacterium]